MCAPAEYPTSRNDWEMDRFGAFGLSPNGRGRRDDYPINDDESPIKVSNFNAVGGSTILYAAHFPRLHPSDFRVKSLDGVADDWPIDYQTLEPWYDVDRPEDLRFLTTHLDLLQRGSGEDRCPRTRQFLAALSGES